MNHLNNNYLNCCSTTIEEFNKCDLKKLHTKQLINLLRSWTCLIEHWKYDYLHDEENSPRKQEVLNKLYFRKKIKEELSTREHVLNKKESLAKRKKNVKTRNKKGKKDK